MSKITIAAILLMTQSALSEEITHADPYADAVSKQLVAQYEAARDGYLRLIHNLFYAVGCGVVPEGIAMGPGSLEIPARKEVEELEIRSGIAAKDRSAVLTPAMFYAAKAAGLAQAKQGCTFWQEHPDLVVALRSRR